MSIQVFQDKRKPSIGERLSGAMDKGVNYMMQMQQKQAQQQQMQRENEAARNLGFNLEGFETPEFRKEILKSGLENQGKKQKSFQDQILEDQRYQTIKSQFGDQAAELYRAAPEGGKTAIINQLIENQSRNQNLNDQLGVSSQQSSQQPTQPEMAAPEPKPTMKTIDYDKGLTPKERVQRQDDRYAKNLPLYQDSYNKLHALEAQGEGLNTLEELSPQIGGFQRLNISPNTGELLIPALASKEAQRFVKTVNDFTTTAKDSYGARVSNFELDRFMKRLPTLANSEEGRAEIIRQMQIINDINMEYERSLQKIVEEHGGIRNIDFDEAQRLAEKQSKSKISGLKKEFRNIDASLDRRERNFIEKEFKANAPKNKTPVRMSNGTLGYIDKDKTAKFLKDKAGEVL